MRDNLITGNGDNPDDEWSLPTDLVMYLQYDYPPLNPLYGDPPVHGNCFEDNIVDQAPLFLAAGAEHQCP